MPSTIPRRHRRALRALRSVHKTIATNTDISPLTNSHFGSDDSPPPSDDEVEFLTLNSLLNDCSFDESTLPPPLLQHNVDSICASKHHRPSPQPPRPSNGAAQPAAEAAVTAIADAAELMAPAAVQTPPADATRFDVDVGTKQAERLQQGVPDDDATVFPIKVAPPAPDEEAKFSAATDELLDLESHHKPAKVVHLPPEDVQEERLRQRREAMEEKRRESESDKISRVNQTELASSPSSTVGALSAATPLAPQDSPDTSPDSEAAELDVPPPKELRPSPEEQRAQEEHDRLLAAQKEIARKQALGEDVTPDDQLRWEAREAASRDRDEKAVGGVEGGSEGDARTAMEETEAEKVLDDARVGDTLQPPLTPAPSQDEKTHAAPSAAPQQVGNNEEGESTAVASQRRISPPAPATTTPRMVTRVSSGAMNRKSVSEILGGTPSHSDEPVPASASKQAVSPALPSPGTWRNPQDASNLAPSAPSHSLRRPVSRSSHQNPSQGMPSRADLTSLRGAAEDIDRDYLEPLFRIQAHDSPNSRTRPLAELTREAKKHLSTEDHFTSVHERMDYRILRRIYQLQNANKWSLRQMEKAREPEQPVSHMDHLMAEMKWMRKDFKAERKMKKSVCAWLAARCADYVNADEERRQTMRVKVKPKTQNMIDLDDQPPALDSAGDSAPEDDIMPPTPSGDGVTSCLVVAPELRDAVSILQQSGTLGKALKTLPIVGLLESKSASSTRPLAPVSKFVEGKILPTKMGPSRKRSRYDYDDDAEVLECQPVSKRMRAERNLEPDDHEPALFHPENKHIRDRLHANNAFRPPSEFAMPSVAFYEFRNGSQWIWEDDQKLRKLAKEYSFNWSLIADEMTLPSRYKSAAQRRTPWECFERWVDLEQLPAEMRKTVYFKTWFNRLDSSQTAAERRYQAAVAAMQAQAQQTGQQAQTPQRRRTVPTRVEKRKDNRYLWLLDGMRKNARKKENNAFKQAEAQRAAAQRKSQNDNANQPRVPRMTPQEFSRRRQDQDLKQAETIRAYRQKQLEAQRAQLAARAAQQQGAVNGMGPQQRPSGPGTATQPGSVQPNGQQSVNMNGQMPSQARPPLPMATRNGHLAVPQVNAQGIPQGQMRSAPPAAHSNSMQRMAHANSQQMSGQYGNQQYQMPNGSMPSPGGHMTTAQQLQQNQQLMAQMQAQAQQHQQGNNSSQGTPRTAQMSASPRMPPPPTPRNQPQQAGQLSSGHMPRLIEIKNSLREKHPNLSDDQLTSAATNELRSQTTSGAQSQHQQQQQARQNAMNAAAGLQPQHGQTSNMQQTYAQNTTAYQRNHGMVNGNTQYMNGDTNGAPTPAMTGPTNSPQAASAYANQLRQRQMAMMQGQMQQSPNAPHAQLAGSPGMAHVSPNMTPASPAVQYPNNMNQMGAGGMSARPPSRNNTPQMQRVGSSGSVPGVGMQSGMQSPGSMPQGSPRNMQANMAR
ncbi:HSA protein [Teratosphaeria destructans]|uniref:Vacuolar import and degradation protein 21 n=1 Tax=Teratosphaeria destructans TaxID=418781 RepID=A0A9W7SMS3_9PEZI|nr:HSA protein [Teratosphaeria destructans]